MSLFSPIMVRAQIESGIVAHLKSWTPTYVAEVCRQQGLQPGEIPAPLLYVTSSEFDKWPEHGLPVCVVIAPTISDINLSGEGDYSGSVEVAIGVVCAAQNQAMTERNSGIYIAAVRAAMVQHPSLGGVATGLVWNGEEYDRLTSSSRRTMGAGMVEFTIQVDFLVNRFAGPTAVPSNPLADPGDWATFDPNKLHIAVKENR